MTSLVENFIINPVLRQARRFSSSPFATGPDHERLRRLSHGSRLQIEDAVAEWNGDDDDLIISPRLALLRIPDIPLGSITPPLLIPSGGYAENEVSRHAIVITGPELQHIVEMTGTDNPLPVQDVEIAEDAPSNEADTASDPNDRTIPADDGKRALRRRVIDIQSRDITPEEKARLMHELLTEGYIEAKRAKTIAQVKPAVIPLDLSTLLGSNTESGSPPSPAIWADPLGAVGNLRFWSASNKISAIPTTIEDRQPTYVPRKPRKESKDSDASDASEDMESSQDLASSEEMLQPLGCEHYKRNVRLQCATCEKWYTCRLCHDAVEDHVLPRRETKHMLCMLCGFSQQASDCCVNCNNTAAQYYCNVCKLWNDDYEKQFYHCDDCGICRVGHGLDKDFFHCNTCRACIAVGNREGHKCIERVTDCDCPICGDHMFTSQRTVIFMDCGHCIHNDCWKLHMQSSYKCPICSKSCVNMETAFRNLDNAIREQPMPEGFHNLKCVILCNDCSAKGPTDFHFLGLKCQTCRSYNTVELQRLPAPGTEDDAESSRDAEGPESVAQGQGPASARLPIQSLWPQDNVSWNHMSGLATASQSPGHHDHSMDDLLVGSSQGLLHRTVGMHTDDDDLDFWGRDYMSDDDDNDDDDSDSAEEDEDDNDEEEDDNEEDIILFGHR